MPVGELLGRAPRRSKGKALWHALVHWRDWSLPVKLSAVTVVPIVIALVLGITTIAAQVGRSDEYQRLDRLVALGGQVRALTGALQQERTVTAAMLTDGTVGGTPELAAARKATDAAVGPFTAAQSRAAAIEPGVAGAAGAATSQLGNLDFLRRQVDGGQLDPGQAITAFSDLAKPLVALDTAATAGAGDGTLGGTPAGLHELLVAGEQVSVSQALVSFGIARAGLSPSELATLRAAELRLGDRLVDFRSAAGDTLQRDFAAIAEGSQAQSRARMVESVLNAPSGAVDDAFRTLSPQDWNAASGAMRTQIGQVADRLGGAASATSAELVDESSSGAGLLAVLLFGAMVLAVAVVFLITRQLLRSLKVLRRSALDVAENALPEAVRNIQEGRAQGTDVRPVPVQTDDEVGEVARAFDKVHHQALRLATEQAAMRTGYGSVFVNLSRRSQSLVQRQLQLIEQLERDEEDADQLATLFQLDHLATRMRRNNENLMVLSGAEPGRRSGKPVGTTDMLRAAVSEIEQYQRVQVQPPPPARIVGYAASDLMRLVAELLDNATAFSAPETSVTVASRLGEDGSLNIDILDKGIGMNEAEVAEANTRLTEAGSVDLATSRRMGLFVVGRLASRHRIGVSLHGGKDIVGVRATVVVPADLVMPVTDGPATGPIGALQQHPASPAAGNRLPRRQVNGHSRPRPVVPQQPAMGEERWPSASDLAGLSDPRPPSDLEISGTALFAPLPKDDDTPPSPPRPTLPAVLPVPPQPPKQPKPDELPAGKDLFSANETTLSDWWRQATATPPAAPAPEPAPDRSETTPIFDEMLSAWFREDKPAAAPATPVTPAPSAPASAPSAEEPAAAEAEPQERRSWDFASDENFRTVQARSQAAPTAFTEAGLPRRRRGEQLMPGSAVPPPAAPTPAPSRPELPVRDPADVRGRLSSFQQGVTRGRQQARQSKPQAAGTEGATPATAAQPGTTAPARQPGGVASAFQPGAGDPAPQQAAGLSPAHQPGTDERAVGAPATQASADQSTGPQPETAAHQSASAAHPPTGTDRQPAGSQPNGLPQPRRQSPPAQSGQPGPGQAGALPNGLLQPGQAGAEPNGQSGPGQAGALPKGLLQPGQAGAEPNGQSGPGQAGALPNGLLQPGQAGAEPNGQSGAGQAGAEPNGQPGPGQAGALPNGLLPPGRPNGLPRPGQAGAQPNGLPQRGQAGAQPDGLLQPGQAGAQPNGVPQPIPPGAPDGLPQRGQTAPPPATDLHPPAQPPSDEPEVPTATGRPSTPPSSLPSRRGAGAETPETPEAPVPREETSAVEVTTEWNFGTDDGWRAVQAVSQSAPATFTSAGLPRRRRGEQLLPGSAGPPTGATAPRPQRDAHDVRGRLRSFQQGIERGRHRTAQAAETNHETLEGE
ncbi:nitrate- and nitrite sensing domain-containing protein [Amycolatopsis sp. FBCC-B4732]|uniref:sensor histidine kinase n=1 Tax=Amycolatopsis sp. FBCC-B4732 TaxID=3079339 RepID=UPI001FF53111|nr:nitrate- and nitrite sensing domain-containing protein [Amycolatopsis sp. FBCC-B4732]UOX93320.1 nitrate- and nitrite sensing domain-containing protein [Amycolatopsis sp. FBCC-B4732]